jgi:hypothetical protein
MAELKRLNQDLELCERSLKAKHQCLLFFDEAPKLIRRSGSLFLEPELDKVAQPAGVGPDHLPLEEHMQAN